MKRQPGRELRNTAITVKMTRTEREQLGELSRHYKASNADVLSWLIASELERIAGSSGEMPSGSERQVPQLDDEQSIRDILSQLFEQVAKLNALVEGQSGHQRKHSS